MTNNSMSTDYAVFITTPIDSSQSMVAATVGPEPMPFIATQIPDHSSNLLSTQAQPPARPHNVCIDVPGQDPAQVTIQNGAQNATLHYSCCWPISRLCSRPANSTDELPQHGQDLTIKTSVAAEATLPRKNSSSYSPRTRTQLPFRDAFFWSQTAAKLGQIDKAQSESGHMDTSTGSENTKTHRNRCRSFCWAPLQGTWANVKQSMKTTRRMFRIAPSCWIAPLILLTLVLGLGVWGVLRSAQREQQHTKDVALAAAEAAAHSFELQLQQTYAPCVTLALMVQQAPQWPDLRPLFLRMAPTLMDQVPSNSLLEIQFAPMGIITDSYPADPAAAGRDLFKEPTRRAIALETVTLGTLTMAGPLMLFQGDLGLVARIPVFLNNQTANETYGMNQSVYECPQCYDPATGRKFWGFSIAIILWKRLTGPNSQLHALTNQKYRWVLRQADPNDPVKLIDIASSPELPTPNDDIIQVNVSLRTPAMRSAMRTSSFTDDWYLIVCHGVSWTPVWRDAAIAGVVVGAFVVAGLLCSVMVNRMQHILSAEDLKESNKNLAETTKNLSEEKQRLDALLERQYALLSMFEKDSSRAVRKSGESVTMERIEAVRRSMAVGQTGSPTSSPAAPLQLQVLELLGEGTFGKVYKGLWRGTKVAIKTLVLPANMSGAEKREKMAVMEAAISSSLSHPNIVQTYTYSVKPLHDSTNQDRSPTINSLIVTNASTTTLPPFSPKFMSKQIGGNAEVLEQSPAAVTKSATNSNGPETVGQPPSQTGQETEQSKGQEGSDNKSRSTAQPSRRPSSGLSDLLDNLEAERAMTPDDSQKRKQDSFQHSSTSSVHSYEVRLVLEYCDKGTLRDAVDQGAFFSPTGLNFNAILETALDIARAMLHLHGMDVLHGDLKARNILLKSCGDDPRGVVAKVGDFGLSVKMDQHATHVSSTFQGTMTHMAPEVMLHGHISRAADVYAYGITLYELFTGSRPFHGVPGALLGHMISFEHKRPTFPPLTPPDFKSLAERCWDATPTNRPTFDEIAAELVRMRNERSGTTQPLYIQVQAPPAAAAVQPLPSTGNAPAGPSPTPANASLIGAASSTGSVLGLGLKAAVPGGLSGSGSSFARGAGNLGKQVRWLEPLPESDHENLVSGPIPQQLLSSDIMEARGSNTSSNANTSISPPESKPLSQSSGPSTHLLNSNESMSRSSGSWRHSGNSDSGKSGHSTPSRGSRHALDASTPALIIGDESAEDELGVSDGLGSSALSLFGKSSVVVWSNGYRISGPALPAIEEGSGRRSSSEQTSRESAVPFVRQ